MTQQIYTIGLSKSEYDLIMVLRQTGLTEMALDFFQEALEKRASEKANGAYAQVLEKILTDFNRTLQLNNSQTPPFDIIEDVLKTSIETAKDTVKKDIKLSEWVFSKTFTCPLCHGHNPSMVARSKYVQVVKIDSDTCTYYRLINPTFYYVVICRHCGFAFTQDSTGKLKITADYAASIMEHLSHINLPNHLSDLRTMDDAITAYRHAIFCQGLVKAKSSVLARLNLRLACLYRQKELPQEEMVCLKEALNHFNQTYMHEKLVDARAELYVAYIIGELYGRLGNLDEAIKWFSLVVNHRDRYSNPYILNMARERWKELKISNK
jgi:uncharacterized protein (DUF2225 family)